MKIYSNQIILLTVAILALGMSLSCQAEVKVLGSDLKASSTQENETKILLYNNSNGTHNFLTGTITVKVNGEDLCKLRIGEYVQIQLPKKVHKLTLSRWDIVTSTSNQYFEVNDQESYLELKAAVGAPTVEFHTKLPAKENLPTPFVCIVKGVPAK